MNTAPPPVTTRQGTTRRRLLIAAGLAVGVTVGLGSVVALAAGGDGGPAETPPSVVAAASPTPSAHTPQPSDFQITVKIVDRTCIFENDICTVVHDIVPTYSGAPLGPTERWRGRYLVHEAVGEVTREGVEFRALYKTFTITGTAFSFERNALAAVPAHVKTLTATVTEVEPA